MIIHIAEMELLIFFVSVDFKGGKRDIMVTDPGELKKDFAMYIIKHLVNNVFPEAKKNLE